MRERKQGARPDGRDGAKAGLMMLAVPVPGIFYRQEYSVGGAKDGARVVKAGIHVSTALGHFTGCIETREPGRCRPVTWNTSTAVPTSAW